MARGAIFNTVSRDLESYRTDTVKKVKDLIADFASQLERKAYDDLNRHSGDREWVKTTGVSSMNFIHIQKKFYNGGLKAEVGVEKEADLAAYIEFGTGLSAREILAPYPQWIRDIAMEFWETGMGTLKGKPYLYNNYLALMPIFFNELDKILKVRRTS